MWNVSGRGSVLSLCSRRKDRVVLWPWRAYIVYRYRAVFFLLFGGMVRDRFVLITGLTATALLAGCQPSEEKLIAESSATVKQYCVECHNYAEQVGGLSLER